MSVFGATPKIPFTLDTQRPLSEMHVSPRGWHSTTLFLYETYVDCEIFLGFENVVFLLWPSQNRKNEENLAMHLRVQNHENFKDHTIMVRFKCSTPLKTTVLSSQTLKQYCVKVSRWYRSRFYHALNHASSLLYVDSIVKSSKISK